MEALYSKEGLHRTSDAHYNTPGEYARQNLFYLEMFGHYLCNGNYSIERESLDNYLMILTTDGCGTVVSGTGEYLCRKMDLILVDCSRPHRYCANGSWEFYWLHFQGNSSRELVRFMTESGCDFVHAEETSLSVQSFLQLIQNGDGTSIDTEINVSAWIHELLADMIRQKMAEQRLTKEPTRIAEAAAYLNAHFSEELSLDQIAQKFLLSKSSFCHKFKQETGFSPYDYLLTKRINQAKYLLRTTELSIGEIALSVGFQSEVNFTRHFKRKNGMTPGAFRQLTL